MTWAPEGLSDGVMWWLLTKPQARLTGARCTSRRDSATAGGLEGYTPMPGGTMHRCSRPVWGDGEGTENGFGAGLCSRCFHEHMAWHGTYTTMTANPAASLLSGDKISGMVELFGAAENRLPATDPREAPRCPAFPPLDWAA